MEANAKILADGEQVAGEREPNLWARFVASDQPQNNGKCVPIVRGRDGRPLSLHVCTVCPCGAKYYVSLWGYNECVEAGLYTGACVPGVKVEVRSDAVEFVGREEAKLLDEQHDMVPEGS